MNVVADVAAKARIDSAKGLPTRADSYNLDRNLDISCTFGAGEFRAELAVLSARSASKRSASMVKNSYYQNYEPRWKDTRTPCTYSTAGGWSG
jgi:hypothetical protein